MQTGVVRKRNTSPLSEFGRQLKEKQTLKREYNLRERQFQNYVKEVLTESRKGAGNSPELLMRRLEMRLDGVVFKMGFAATRAQARQMVTHGHFLVGGKPVDVPSMRLKKGDVITLRPSSMKKPLFQNLQLSLKKFEAPAWIQLDKEKMEAAIIGEPSLQEISPNVELSLIFEFYSR